MSEGIVRSLGLGRFSDWRARNAEGAAGGILICWDKRVLEILDWEEGQFSLSCRFKITENGAIWVFTGVYGPFTKVEREGMWEELGAIRGLWGDPWCLGGRVHMEWGLNNQAWARLDRFLVSPSWLDQFSGVTQGRLSRPISDHFPIVLEGGGVRRGPTPFRFENMWLKVEGFNDIIRTWWQEIEVRGSASYRLAVKMKEIKKKLKVWNKEVFGRLETNKASALHQLDFWDRVESERILSMEEAELKKEAKDSFKKWVLLEEAHWRQHSREIWLKDGDRNTGFFHRMASAHRRNNAMDRIKVNGEWLVEEQEVREGVVNSFQQLLSEDMGWQADIGSIQVNCISQQEAESLETPFAETEIHSALMEMNGDKSPGPDGFTVAFWQNAWDFAKEEIMEMFKEFHEHNSFVKSLNNTFLVLIPKKSGAENLGDFRPISLVGGLYKLLAKVLANRLKKVIGKVVSYTQNAFVMGRQILDASLIANEVIDSWQKKKEKGLVCKLDIEKLMIASIEFLNEVPAGFFPSTRGLRQGDPLSPYLFVMGMEVLDVLIRRAVEGGYLSGKEQVSHLSWILFWFEAASGLRINLAKSEIIPIGEVEDSLELAAELGCRVGSLPSHYLGLPLGVPNRATSMWDGVEERIRRRLALWKRQYISKGGRITLIKSTLASLPTYQMSIFRMPKSVAKRVEKTQRDFLWGGGNLEGKVHLVKWDAVCTEKHKGGLGLRRIATLNRALLGKWIWRFACEKNNFWNQVITTKYGQEDYGWRPKKVRGPAGVGVWKEIMKEDDWCWDNLAFRVGKGSKIKFWKDCWCTDTPLSQCFNQLFVLAVHRDATIEEMWDHDAGQGDWKLVFVRDFNDWEMDMVGELLHTLRGQRPSLEDDSVVWRQGRNGIFKIKEAYRLLDKSNATVFPARKIWVDRVPTKVCFFCLGGYVGKVLTLDRLQLRGVQLPNCCYLCGCEEENVHHILLHCIVTRALWEIIFGLIDV
ncbi:putative ribonuclease H protein [Vitis vinifera]|uniref:Putative ribonuclease H protein n=1 Tax=Vitis vinifera TaxID=29760 RepID=A0A438CDH8_VITVI|nr:putative ribonuclease H protein [Vitis vinifera]